MEYVGSSGRLKYLGAALECFAVRSSIESNILCSWPRLALSRLAATGIAIAECDRDLVRKGEKCL